MWSRITLIFISALSFSHQGKYFDKLTKMKIVKFVFFCKVLGGCYFPVEVQGEYVTQSMIDSEIAYTSLTITYDSIPGENRLILK